MIYNIYYDSPPTHTCTHTNDSQVDFAPPVGYQPPEPEKMSTDTADAAIDVCTCIKITFDRLI